MRFSIHNVTEKGVVLIPLPVVLGTIFLIIPAAPALAAAVGNDNVAIVAVIAALAGAWLLGVPVLRRWLFRCPRCRTSTFRQHAVPTDNPILPERAHRQCPTCGLDFETRTFWASDNAVLRQAWRAQRN